MLQTSSNKDKKEFRSLVLHLKKLYPSWKTKEITRFIMKSENPPSYSTSKALWFKISRILKRKTIDDLPRSGAPRTTTTPEYLQVVRETIELKRNTSIRNANDKLNRQGYRTSKSSVWRVKNELKLKWWKRKTVQKLTDHQKIQRATIAKRLRKHYGVKKGSKFYKWNKVLNTDFSGTFLLTPQANQHNEGVYPKSSNDIPYELKTKSKQKFQKNVILWGGISYQGLFSSQSPIFTDEWLDHIRPEGTDRRTKMYFTSDRYAKFIQTIVAKKAAKELDNLEDVIFQDDQDNKQRMPVALDAVKNVFTNRIEPINCDAKLADI
ncbi:unnamed protein product [Rotaria sp. Silwood2]|nr:unnamed protein product [Rotaria sp. Silwood2]CAF2953080.1 unnamed protein product [Rotaria sp. Silwood2]CAF4119927.1 unnamed protein product [Rotaria sp. Silwood2]CAF4266896.1 unnamed protein product [Rotaria sp. Silwood2]